MSLDKTIVVANEFTLNQAMTIINGNWKAMQEAGHPLAVKVYEHRSNATYEQQKYMWLRVTEIAQQVWINGRQFSADTWHEFLKRELLPDEEGPTKRCRKGYRKWDYLPSGERVLVGSTNGLTTFGKREYQEKLEAYGASLGVRFSANPREYQECVNYR